MALEDAYKAIAGALTSQMPEWHEFDPQGCRVVADALPQIVGEAAGPYLVGEQPETSRRRQREIEAMRAQVRVLRRRLAKLEALADAAGEARTWDYALY